MRTQEAERLPRSDTTASRLRGVFLALGALMVGAAGLMLWASQSESVFAAYLVGALASCF